MAAQRARKMSVGSTKELQLFLKMLKRQNQDHIFEPYELGTNVVVSNSIFSYDREGRFVDSRSMGDEPKIEQPCKIEQPSKTELEQMIAMLDNSGIQHTIKNYETGITIRIGDVYSYSLWSFTIEGKLKSQFQFESTE